MLFILYCSENNENSDPVQRYASFVHILDVFYKYFVSNMIKGLGLCDCLSKT